MSEFPNPYQDTVKEGPGQKGHRLAGMLRPLFSWLGIRFNEDALASVLTSLVVYVKARIKASKGNDQGGREPL